MSTKNDIDKLADAMTFLVRSMHRPRAWEEIVKRAGVELDRPGVAILHSLALCSKEQAKCNVQYLAHHLGVEAPSVSRKIQELEQDKFIDRSVDPQDKRAVVLKLTAKGSKVLERIQRAKRDALTAQLRHWDTKDRQQFVELFYRFAHDMNQDQPL
ncbi:MAG TPA: MarR family transcriptional regulator [Candidatus Saccharimonadales bacterium]|nr:MarR family transcriptional regulator [Candidatus Saccharimonadales bacterium]